MVARGDKVHKRRKIPLEEPYYKMNKTDVREQNLYFQMESIKQTDVGIYDEVVGETPATKQTVDKFPHGTEKETQSSTQRKNACPSHTVVIKRVVFISKTAALIIVFLAAVVALILAVITMVSRNDQSPSKDSADVAGK